MANRALGEPGRVEGAVFHVKHSFEKPSPVRRRGGGMRPDPVRLRGGSPVRRRLRRRDPGMR